MLEVTVDSLCPGKKKQNQKYFVFQMKAERVYVALFKDIVL